MEAGKADTSSTASEPDQPDTASDVPEVESVAALLTLVARFLAPIIAREGRKGDWTTFRVCALIERARFQKAEIVAGTKEGRTTLK